jgi:hypothetical protein
MMKGKESGQYDRKQPSTCNCVMTMMTRGRQGITTITTITTRPPTTIMSNCSQGVNGEQEGQGQWGEARDMTMMTGM